ncbi:gluconate 2-dehydrogenase subunit 3 family protein [Hymenobacter sp. ASUV-10]|uniref:Gluconate 2-dehydrogenase subunit 3 family protein n=1 Tax=Hymenobacter aranciens TaxID=3063996 RepID=A0ABT9BC70_9BACT|nr:gluconate 2-dehydrogenase subunit 3 family protein [Hymenobacter sp. ASUV-10]MDO7875857.1 gluconate 2-dehydrogenase subunit 3 family protein [Hymenobacter sp. ASUV-10]
MISRREALARVALLMGGTAIIGSDAFLSGCGPSDQKQEKQPTAAENPGPPKDLLTPEQTAYLTEVADTMLPATKTPGAKAANVGPFMAVMVRDCYVPADQQVFVKGLDQLEEACKKQHDGKGFLGCTPEQRLALLRQLDAEQKQYSKTKPLEAPNHYFRMMKELALLGFFTSEVGATQALRYLPVPGKFVGDYPYKKGDRAWATS